MKKSCFLVALVKCQMYTRKGMRMYQDLWSNERLSDGRQVLLLSSCHSGEGIRFLQKNQTECIRIDESIKGGPKTVVRRRRAGFSSRELNMKINIDYLEQRKWMYHYLWISGKHSDSEWELVRVSAKHETLRMYWVKEIFPKPSKL